VLSIFLLPLFPSPASLVLGKDRVCGNLSPPGRAGPLLQAAEAWRERVYLLWREGTGPVSPGAKLSMDNRWPQNTLAKKSGNNHLVYPKNSGTPALIYIDRQTSFTKALPPGISAGLKAEVRKVAARPDLCGDGSLGLDDRSPFAILRHRRQTPIRRPSSSTAANRRPPLRTCPARTIASSTSIGPELRHHHPARADESSAATSPNSTHGAVRTLAFGIRHQSKSRHVLAPAVPGFQSRSRSCTSW